jgi:hypothetical protein
MDYGEYVSTKYQIILKGHLDQDWDGWFSDMEIQYDQNDNTILVGWVVDNSAFFGLLDRLRDLNITIISINELEIDE